MQINDVKNSVLQGLAAPAAKSRQVVSGPQALSEEQKLQGTTLQNIIENASQIPDLDMEKIAKAKKLLASGDLTSDENIKKAAENIVKLGF